MNLIKAKSVVVIKSLLLFVILLFSSCDPDDCRENMYITAGVMFKHYQNPANNVLLEGLSVKTLDNKYNELNTVLQDTVLAAVQLQLNPDSDTSRFMFTSNYLNDVLVVVHSNNTEFVSAECGTRTLFRIDTAYIANIGNRDSVSVITRKVEEMYDNENIEVYLYIQ